MQPTIPAQTVLFDDRFLLDHAGQIIADPRVAIIELVANSWDAGATLVSIKLPFDIGGTIAVGDNGIGMTYEEFDICWRTINYDRRRTQGDKVRFPDGVTSTRRPFGRNGKGRHAMFCFADEYIVETCKNGILNRFRVTKGTSAESPFQITYLGHEGSLNNGTTVSTDLQKNLPLVEDIASAVGSRFIADPQFRITVNAVEVTLETLNDYCMQETVSTDIGDVQVLCFDAQQRHRTSQHHGVAWWVDERLVGEPSWEGVEGPYLDRRSSEAKRYTFVVRANILRDWVKADWSGFIRSQETDNIRSVIEEFVAEQINKIFSKNRRERKLEVLKQQQSTLRKLSVISQEHISKFIDNIQQKCPTMGESELAHVTSVLVNLEASRSRYTLLEQLAILPPEDLDGLVNILNGWSIAAAKTVLDELQRRLMLIEQLSEIVNKKKSDELHELQPVFEKGLWIFGPEYDSIEYTSNKTLSTSIKALFKGNTVTNSRLRADFVCLPDTSFGLYSRNRYGNDGEIDGIDKVVIVELKRSGFEITLKEMQQAQTYVMELRKAPSIRSNTKFAAFVLGTTCNEDAKPHLDIGDFARINALDYDTVLRKAHARTFNLLNKLKSVNGSWVTDADVQEALRDSNQLPLPIDAEAAVG